MDRLEEIAADLNLGGIEFVVSVPTAEAPELVERLMGCGHGHVFVIDQSRSAGHHPVVRLGLSQSGVRCVGMGALVESGAEVHRP